MRAVDLRGGPTELTELQAPQWEVRRASPRQGNLPSNWLAGGWEGLPSSAAPSGVPHREGRRNCNNDLGESLVRLAAKGLARIPISGCSKGSMENRS